MMKKIFQYFFMFIHVNYCDSKNYLITTINNNNNNESSLHENIDNSADVLNPIINHCGEENWYKQLMIIKSNGNNYSTKFDKNVNEKLLIPVQLFDDFKELDNVPSQTCVILFVSKNDVNNFLTSLVKKYFLTADNVYVVRLTSSESNETIANLRNIWSSSANELWKKNSVHKFVLSINEVNLIYDPLQSSKSLNEEFIKNLYEFPELLKGRTNFYGYDVNVAIFPYVTIEKIDQDDWSGLDANLMEEICRKMNVTATIFEPKDQFGWFKDGKYFGTLGRLVYRQSDLAFNGFFVKYYETDELEFSSYLNMDKICVIVPSREKIPAYLLIVRIFSLSSWVLIFIGNSFLVLTFILITSVNFRTFVKKDESLQKSRRKYYFQKPFRSERNKSLKIVKSCLATLIFLSFYPIKIKNKYLSLRIHVTFGLIFGIVIGGCFTSKLASSFSKPAFLKNIDTLKELDKSGLKILTSFPDLMNDVFADNESSTFRNLESKLELKLLPEINNRVYKKRNAGYLNRKQTVTLAGNLNNELHVVSDCPREYHLAFPILRGSPFLQRMNSIIGRLQNGGFLFKWFKDMKKNVKKNEDNKNPVIISLPHLYIPFFILITGTGISLGIFFCELNDRFNKK